MMYHWSSTAVFMLCLFQCTGAFTIQNETDLEELKQFITELSRQIQTLNDTILIQKEKAKNVMFYAVIRGKSYTYNVDANIVFETVIVNKGGHYDRYDGVFVAPVSGTYLFSWTLSGSGKKYIVAELMVGGNVVSSTGEYNGSGGHPSGSMTALCEMRTGDHAWIRSTGITSGQVLYSVDNYPQSGFLGLLIVPD